MDMSEGCFELVQHVPSCRRLKGLDYSYCSQNCFCDALDFLFLIPQHRAGNSSILGSHLYHWGSCLSVECHRGGSRGPIFRGPYPDCAPCHVSAGSIAGSAYFGPGHNSEGHGPLGHSVPAMDLQQERLHCSASIYCGLKSQVDWEHTAGREGYNWVLRGLFVD